MKIGTLMIRIGTAAFVTALAGKIIHVTVAHSQEAIAEMHAGFELPFANSSHGR